MRNQYFQLEFRETSACLHIYPPLDGGQMLSISEVTEYLAAKKLDKYDLKELNAAITNHQEDSPYHIFQLVSLSLFIYLQM